MQDAFVDRRGERGQVVAVRQKLGDEHEVDRGIVEHEVAQERGDP